MTNPTFTIVIGEPLNYTFEVIDIFLGQPLTVGNIWEAARASQSLCVRDDIGNESKMIFSPETVVAVAEAL